LALVVQSAALAFAGFGSKLGAAGMPPPGACHLDSATNSATATATATEQQEAASACDCDWE